MSSRWEIYGFTKQRSYRDNAIENIYEPLSYDYKRMSDSSQGISNEWGVYNTIDEFERNLTSIKGRVNLPNLNGGTVQLPSNVVNIKGICLKDTLTNYYYYYFIDDFSRIGDNVVEYTISIDMYATYGFKFLETLKTWRRPLRLSKFHQFYNLFKRGGGSWWDYEIRTLNQSAYSFFQRTFLELPKDIDIENSLTKVYEKKDLLPATYYTFAKNPLTSTDLHYSLRDKNDRETRNKAYWYYVDEKDPRFSHEFNNMLRIELKNRKNASGSDGYNWSKTWYFLGTKGTAGLGYADYVNGNSDEYYHTDSRRRDIISFFNACDTDIWLLCSVTDVWVPQNERSNRESSEGGVLWRAGVAQKDTVSTGVVAIPLQYSGYYDERNAYSILGKLFQSGWKPLDYVDNVKLGKVTYMGVVKMRSNDFRTTQYMMAFNPGDLFRKTGGDPWYRYSNLKRNTLIFGFVINGPLEKWEDHNMGLTNEVSVDLRKVFNWDTNEPFDWIGFTSPAMASKVLQFVRGYNRFVVLNTDKTMTYFPADFKYAWKVYISYNNIGHEKITINPSSIFGRLKRDYHDYEHRSTESWRTNWMSAGLANVRSNITKKFSDSYLQAIQANSNQWQVSQNEAEIEWANLNRHGIGSTAVGGVGMIPSTLLGSMPGDIDMEASAAFTAQTGRNFISSLASFDIGGALDAARKAELEVRLAQNKRKQVPAIVQDIKNSSSASAPIPEIIWDAPDLISGYGLKWNPRVTIDVMNYVAKNGFYVTNITSDDVKYLGNREYRTSAMFDSTLNSWSYVWTNETTPAYMVKSMQFSLDEANMLANINDFETSKGIYIPNNHKEWLINWLSGGVRFMCNVHDEYSQLHLGEMVRWMEDENRQSKQVGTIENETTQNEALKWFREHNKEDEHPKKDEETSEPENTGKDDSASDGRDTRKREGDGKANPKRSRVRSKG